MVNRDAQRYRAACDNGAGIGKRHATDDAWDSDDAARRSSRAPAADRGARNGTRGPTIQVGTNATNQFLFCIIIIIAANGFADFLVFFFWAKPE